MWQAIHLVWVRWDFIRRIRKRGWTGTYIPGTETETNFAYSTGFWECLGTPRSLSSALIFGPRTG